MRKQMENFLNDDMLVNSHVIEPFSKGKVKLKRAFKHMQRKSVGINTLND